MRSFDLLFFYHDFYTVSIFTLGIKYFTTWFYLFTTPFKFVFFLIRLCPSYGCPIDKGERNSREKTCKNKTAFLPFQCTAIVFETCVSMLLIRFKRKRNANLLCVLCFRRKPLRFELVLYGAISNFGWLLTDIP